MSLADAEATMAIREIVEWPSAILKKRCEAVATFDAELHTLLDDMVQTMRVADGLGLAANQVAVSKRIFVMAIPDDDEGGGEELFEIINPVIEARRGEQRFEEGCLSFPGISEMVVRAAEIDLAYVDRDGAAQRRTLGGIAAVCAQHELDHLDGITFIDRLSALKKRLALRAYQREKRARLAEQRDEATAALRR